MFNKVTEFEDAIASFFGAKYAVATDCCTHAIELCLRYTGASNVTCPTRTYISIPFTFMKLGLTWSFKDTDWKDYYLLGNTNIIDAAVLWENGSYIPGTYMCLSFQFKKHLNLGRGGMILCDNKADYTNLKRLSYDGRDLEFPWAEQNISTVGYHYYMTPETATTGIEQFNKVKDLTARTWTYKDYPYLPNMDVFRDDE